MSTASFYQELYEDPALQYGSAAHGRCPGVRSLPLYRHWLIGSVIDLGCGTGDTVRALRDEGVVADGLDQVNLPNAMRVGDITAPLDLGAYRSAICLDVLEHIDDSCLEGLLENLAQVERQVVTVHIGSAREAGRGVELHINRKSFGQWEAVLDARLDVCRMTTLDRRRMLFLCRRKPTT